MDELRPDAKQPQIEETVRAIEAFVSKPPEEKPPSRGLLSLISSTIRSFKAPSESTIKALADDLTSKIKNNANPTEIQEALAKIYSLPKGAMRKCIETAAQAIYQSGEQYQKVVDALIGGLRQTLHLSENKPSASAETVEKKIDSTSSQSQVKQLLLERAVDPKRMLLAKETALLQEASKQPWCAEIVGDILKQYPDINKQLSVLNCFSGGQLFSLKEALMKDATRETRLIIEGWEKQAFSSLLDTSYLVGILPEDKKFFEYASSQPWGTGAINNALNSAHLKADSEKQSRMLGNFSPQQLGAVWGHIEKNCTPEVQEKISNKLKTHLREIVDKGKDITAEDKTFLAHVSQQNWLAQYLPDLFATYIGDNAKLQVLSQFSNEQLKAIQKNLDQSSELHDRDPAAHASNFEVGLLIDQIVFSREQP